MALLSVPQSSKRTIATKLKGGVSNVRMRCLVPRVCRRSVFSDLLQHSSKLLVLAPSFICLPSLAVLLLLAGNYESIVHFAEGKDLVCLHLRHVRRDIRGYFDQCEAYAPVSTR